MCSSNEEVIQWIRQAWSMIDEDLVDVSLKRSFTHPDLQVSETAIFKHERLGPSFLESVSNVSVQGTQNLVNEFDDLFIVDE